MNIVNDFVPANIMVKLKLPNQRAYEVAWSIALLRGYENLDEFVNDVFLDGYRYPNGVCISGDGRFLYTSSNKPSEAFINEFDTATLTFVRVVAKENSDGIKCDRHNNFYLANKEGVLIINKEGKRIGLISLPTIPANLCWGGREGNDLFITARENIFLILDLQRNVVP